MKSFLLALTITLFGANVLAQPAMEVFKSPTCGCCSQWVEHMEANGFTVTTQDTHDMHQVKMEAGIAPEHASCHTGFVEGYFIEGHVPAADVRRLLEQKPDAKGLTVPGMPVGSPGMEMGDRQDAYQVLLVKKDGSTEVFSEYP